ncbi:MAG: endopeptidase La [Bacteroidales bacterium]|nr:endopeptidase La [Bacteroidales bacterium]
MKFTTDFEELGELLARGANVKANIVPVIEEGDEEVLLHDDSIENEMPVLPVMDQVLFPGVLIPIAARRPKSRRLLDDVNRSHEHIVIFPQQNSQEDPTELDLYPVGVVAKVLKVFSFRDDITVAIMQGIERCHSLAVTSYDPYMRGTVTRAPESAERCDTKDFRQRMKLLRKQYAEMMRNRMQDDEMGSMLANIGSDKIFINFAATHMDIEVAQKYELLACDNYYDRAEKMLEQLNTLKGLDELRREIDSKTREEMDRQQREYYLRQQMSVIQEELGNSGPAAMWADSEVEELRKRAAEKQWPDAVAKAFDSELTRMMKTSPMSSDYTVELTYLETLLDVPWTAPEEDAAAYDIRRAREVMDKDHYGIEKVKDRITEYLAVRKRQVEKGVKAKAQVLCLVGPPGTGKTSICRSIAEAMGRPYRRVALGGLHDEAEIRGHRRTYVGAMPGRIMQEFIKAGVANPVFVLDEIDKVQASAHGDPSSALLEVLDPEQNCHFHDNFINLDYDLSRAFFIATANDTSAIHPALLDRMEVIDFSGYLLEEKLEIAKRHLLPRLMHDAVVDRRTMRFTPEVLATVVNDYTREGGVRQLEKQLSKVVRHRVVRLEHGEKCRATVDAAELKKALGLPIHNSERRLPQGHVGVVTGLAWTPVGGEILFIESSLSKGKGTLTLTGNLGDVMKESATLAFEYIKANGDRYGIDGKLLEERNVHIHVPEGAVPKDGPSAGITMFVSMVSVLTGRRVRPEVAMTGEITLRGEVTPIGGVKEKILAAKRAGITDIILCHDNRRDVEEIEPRYLDGLSFHYIGEMGEALALALEDGEGKEKKTATKTAKGVKAAKGAGKKQDTSKKTK